MRNDTDRWAATTVGQKAPASFAGVTMSHVTGLEQTLISGPRAAALSHVQLTSAIGWPDCATGERYAVSLRRDRVLAIGFACGRFGWNDEAGLAISQMSQGYGVVDLTGPDALPILQTGTELSPKTPSASAVRLWHGYDLIVYALGHNDGFRLHIPAALLEAAWDMLSRQAKLIGGS
ncbi:hypothetical protein [Yoonia sp. SS1-5]|uniref:Uncharacterized protein n=1 Tax=Yoonia rhodophyticola TaxID=3137370 RepID=A0AAN0MBF2_9RHOB